MNLSHYMSNDMLLLVWHGFMKIRERLCEQLNFFKNWRRLVICHGCSRSRLDATRLKFAIMLL